MVAPVNYSTSVAVDKTVAEISAILARYGADQVSVRYVDQMPVAISFDFSTPAGLRTFVVSADSTGMRALLVEKDRKGQLKTGSKASRTSPEQAARVTWRVLKDWVAAQMALVDARLVTVDQVFLPYLMISADGETLYDKYANHEAALMLPVSVEG